MDNFGFSWDLVIYYGSEGGIHLPRIYYGFDHDI
jgi:hypothetical protein